MPELRDATVVLGVPGLNGSGITAPEKTTITNDLAALKAATYITQTASATLSAEQALSTLATGLVKVTTATGVLSTAVAADLPVHTHTGVTTAASFLIDGGGVVIASGVKGDLQVPFAGTITGWTVLADQSGTLSVGVWRDTYANYPPVVGDLLLTVAVSVDTKATVSGLSHAIVAGDILRFNVTSTATSITRASIILTMTRSI